MKATKGDWVEIENVILQPDQRSINLPEDTRKTPVKMWARGFLNTDTAEVGDTIEIITLADRSLKGTLIEIKPKHNYDFGDTIIELIHVGNELQTQLSKILEQERLL